MKGSSKEALKGGYVLEDCEGTPDVILIATGSEVGLAVKAKAELEKDGMKIRVVSMPCMDLFEEQSAEYRESSSTSEGSEKESGSGGVRRLWLGRYVGWTELWYP